MGHRTEEPGKWAKLRRWFRDGGRELFIERKALERKHSSNQTQHPWVWQNGKLGSAATCPSDKKYFFAQAHFTRSWSMFSRGVPRSPLKQNKTKKKHEEAGQTPSPFLQADCLPGPLSYLTARWREGRWHSMHFSQEAGRAEVTGRAQTRRQGVSRVYWVVSSFKGKHGETEAWWLELWASPWTSLSLSLVIYQMGTTPTPHITVS